MYNKLKLVKFDFLDLPQEYWKQYPFTEKDVFVVLGEIEQMPGHGVIANIKTGQIFCGYDLDGFKQLLEEET